jgi:glycerol-3-phosphate acyltransferase PlsY
MPFFDATAALLVLAGYLSGSISTAIVTCRLMGLPDPRSRGSGNPGATNVLRHGGNKAAVITLLGDLLKGLLPVLVAKLLGMGAVVQAAVACAAFLGHLYPLYFGFKGGKGVATSLGGLSALSPWLGLAVLGTWLAVAALSRISSLSALVAALCAPGYAAWLLGSPPVTGLVAGMSLLLAWRHRSNIRKLLAGTEDRFTDRRR